MNGREEGQKLVENFGTDTRHSQCRPPSLEMPLNSITRARCTRICRLLNVARRLNDYQLRRLESKIRFQLLASYASGHFAAVHGRDKTSY